MPEHRKKACCVPIAQGGVPAAQGELKASADAPQHGGTVHIPGGVPIVGTSQPLIMNDGEELRRAKTLKPFRIGATTVTNAQFSRFIEETGYETDAERLGWSFVFWHQVPEGIENPLGVEGTEWWRRVEGANWLDINGPAVMDKVGSLTTPSCRFLGTTHVRTRVGPEAGCPQRRNGNTPPVADWRTRAIPGGKRTPTTRTFSPAISGRVRFQTAIRVRMAIWRQLRRSRLRQTATACSMLLGTHGSGPLIPTAFHRSRRPLRKSLRGCPASGYSREVPTFAMPPIAGDTGSQRAPETQATAQPPIKDFVSCSIFRRHVQLRGQR